MKIKTHVITILILFMIIASTATLVYFPNITLGSLILLALIILYCTIYSLVTHKLK